MSALSDPIARDIARRANLFGLILGAVSIPVGLATGFMGGCLGSCCPFAALGGVVGLAPVIMMGMAGGGLAAMFLDWNQIDSESAIRVGARVGARTGLIATSLGSLTTFLTSAVMTAYGSLSMGSMVAGLHPENSEQQATAFGSALGLGVFGVVISLVVCVLAVPIGAGLGALGGVIGAAIKRK